MQPYMTPASLLADEPVTFESENGRWSPQNYDKQFRGNVTLRNALEQSLNVPAVRVAKAVGTQPILDVIRQLGVTTVMTNDLSLALGSPAVSLLDMVTAYGTMANGGIFVRPTSLRAASDREGMTLWTATPERRQAVSPQAAYLVTSLLEGVVRRGTAAKAKVLGLTGAIAGKTGTTDGYRDAWFVGYTSDLVIGVWVGFDDERAIRLTGSQAALPIWMDIARRMLPEQAVPFSPPAGVVAVPLIPRQANWRRHNVPNASTKCLSRAQSRPCTVKCTAAVSGNGFDTRSDFPDPAFNKLLGGPARNGVSWRRC